MKTQVALMLVLLTSCRNEAPNRVQDRMCRVVTFSASNVYDRAAELTIGGIKRRGVFWYLIRPLPDEQSGEVTQKICGKVPVRFRSGTLDVVATVDASTNVNVVYIDPTQNPVIWSTDDPYPVYD